MQPFRSSPWLTAALLSLAIGCGGGPTAAQAAKETKSGARNLAKAPSEGKEIEVKAEKKDPNAVEHPWTFEQVRDAMPLGTVLVYKRAGTDLNGKKVDDVFRWVIRKSSDDQVGTSGTVDGGGEDQPSGEVAMAKWTKFSPFFIIENPTAELTGREKVTVAAGEFDCMVADMKGFFGNRKSVWMIVDKPGVYAKVVEHPNEGEEKDKTNLTWELQEITKAAGG